MTIIQVTVTDEDRLPEDGSYQKSRTRATVDLSAWTAKKVERGVELTYVVKVSSRWSPNLGSKGLTVSIICALKGPPERVHSHLGRADDLARDTNVRGKSA